MIDIKELNEKELEKVSGGEYNPNTGKGLTVGSFIRNPDKKNIYYKIININTSYYDVDTYKTAASGISPYDVLIQIRFEALVQERFVPCDDPGGLHKVTGSDYL